jgi:superfamily II DNA or RNA helicase
MFAAGDVVTVRGDRWIIEEATPLSDCTLLRLSNVADRVPRRRECKLLHPFDRPIVSRRTPCIRAVTRRRWMGLLQSQLAEFRAFGQLRAAQLADIDIHSFQLEPALALIQGRSSRFLLADEVGLGKTIQAGLMLAELETRGWCERALILTPAGLRRQWADELERRFHLRPAILDAATLRARTATLPSGVNPWAVEPVVITSIDFVKQPEVLRGLMSHLWDLIIIDEAHQVATAPLRAAATKALTERARHVVLLTATPHAGNAAAYRALCSLGQLGAQDSILLFQRTREQVGLKRARRVHLLPVRMSADALEMHRLLEEYIRELWQIAHRTGRPEVQLVAIVLGKRAYSSAASLAISIERRIAGLSRLTQPPAQSSLPFGDEEDVTDAEPSVDAPAFDQVDREEQMLRAILAAAERARTHDRKVAALLRFLRRIREPVIVFTEYRDTLATLANAVGQFRPTAVLHGGLNPAERHLAVDAFTSGAADLLLTTDAGSEGLNLQSGCRIVINLELPWNPIRLEQRIGRVDRFGQSRTVHAINLFARETAESTILTRLVKRLDRIRSSEIEIASCVIHRIDPVSLERDAVVETCTVRANLVDESKAETARLRSLARKSTRHTVFANRESIPVTAVRLTASAKATAVKKPDTTFGVRPAVICFVHAQIVNGAGRLIEDMLVPLELSPSSSTESSTLSRRRHARTYAEQFVQTFGASVTAFAETLIEIRAAQIQSASADWVTRSLIREQDLSKIVAADATGLIQAGLFDTRAVKLHEEGQQRRSALVNEIELKAESLKAAGLVAGVRNPRIAFLLITC